MNCPNCRVELPTADPTICPNCHANLQTIPHARAGDHITGDQINIDQINQPGNLAIGTGAQINVIQPPKPDGPPLQRPPRAEHFQDRQDELAQLLDQLQPGQVATLCGPGGMGKSALAAEAIWTLAPANDPPARFPDGIVFHSFYNQPQIALALEQIALSFGEDPRGSVQDAAQRALSRRTALLVLDGTEAADNLSALLDIRNRCGVLITSRERRDALSSRQDLHPLPDADAVTLLQEWAGAQANDPTTHQRIVELVGRLPLAVRLAGRYLAQSGMAARDYCRWLSETPLTALDQGQRQSESMLLLLARSLAQLSHQAQTALATLGLPALAPFPVEAITASLALENQWTTISMLGELVNYGLLLHNSTQQPNQQTNQQPTYQLSHALIHTYAHTHLTPQPHTLQRLVAWLTETINQNQTNFPLLATLRPHVITLQERCAEASMWQEVEDLAWAIEDYLDLQGYWIERLSVIQAAQTNKARQAEGVWLGNLGRAYVMLGQVEKAIEQYQQALAIAIEIGDRRAQGNHLGNLGIAYRDLGQVEEAIEQHQQALAIAIEIGDRRSEGVWLGNLGNAYRNLGQVEEAIEQYQQALAIAIEIGDRRNEGVWLGNLGNTYADLGQVEEAIEQYQQALVIFEEIKSPSADIVRSWLTELTA
ncbi:tetratricopeptide repeat protein [Chloroflexi bacterium TSY]|nr:tetratricopeptide repeat protein [Chloroflexi bacterium TSY]